LPSHVDAIALENLIRDCWAKVEWGHGRILVRDGAGFDPQWPVLNLAVADFEILLHCNRKVIISCPNAISFVYPAITFTRCLREALPIE
jgi:hypothetical protein